MRKRPALRGRWAQGLEPRCFNWVIKERLAICERPGGYGEGHRKVRRQEELIWISTHGFTNILSFVDALPDSRGYDEGGIYSENISLGRKDDQVPRLREMYLRLDELLSDPERVVLAHAEELGDVILGIIGGYLVFAGMVPAGPESILVAERLTKRQLSTVGRSLIAATIDAGLRREAKPAPDLMDQIPDVETAGL